MTPRALAGPILMLALLSSAHADPAPSMVEGEVDPLPFANGGYGAQVGVRPAALHGLRIALASFSLHVPDVVSQLGGNDRFDLRVRPSIASYFLYYLEPAGHDGLCVGMSIRYLRLRYEHDDVPGEHADVSELSPEAIIGYQWHPFHDGFYAQPWFALGIALTHSHDAVVGDKRYSELPVSPFFTINLGWEHAL